MEMTTGQRLARARKLRGMTQAQLAERVGRSASWVAKVERGHAALDRRSVLDRLAGVLDVEVVELTGQPYRPATPEAQSGHAGIPALRLAIQRLTVPTAISTGLPRAIDDVERDLVLVERDRVDARYDDVARVLPGLIADIAAGGTDPRWSALMVRAGHLARVIASMTGHHDLAWVALTIQQAAASRTEDPLDDAAAAWDLCGAWLHTGAVEEARASARTALDALDAHVGTSAEVDAMWGALHLRAAIAESRRYDHNAAREHLSAAQAITTPATGARLVQTAYTPANAQLHALEAAVELAHPRDAVTLAEQVDPTALGSDERVAHYWLCTGQASCLNNDKAGALRALVTAHSIAGPHVATRPMARELVTALLGRHRQAPAELRRIAGVMGMT